MSGLLDGARAVFFDVDDTLYDFERSMEYAFSHLRKAFPRVLGAHGEDQLSQAYWSYYRGYGEDAKSELIHRDPDAFRRTMWQGALARLGVEAGDAFVQELTDEFQRHRPAHWRAAMFPGALDTLRDLKARGLRLGVMTNGPALVQRPKLEAFAYRDHFPEPLVFVSGEFGARKPDPSIFVAAAKAADVRPDECVMVGDAREFDMPAKAVGFRTVLFDGRAKRPDCSADAWPPDAVVTTYDELRHVLGL